MSFNRWLLNMKAALRTVVGETSRRGKSPRKHAFRPSLETLEDRVVPTITWVNRGLPTDNFDAAFGAGAPAAPRGHRFGCGSAAGAVSSPHRRAGSSSPAAAQRGHSAAAACRFKRPPPPLSAGTVSVSASATGPGTTLQVPRRRPARAPFRFLLGPFEA